MKYKACILAVVLIVLVSGVVGSYLQQKIVCEGEDCCVDANENEQCDPDEPLIQMPEPPGRAHSWYAPA